MQYPDMRMSYRKRGRRRYSSLCLGPRNLRAKEERSVSDGGQDLAEGKHTFSTKNHVTCLDFLIHTLRCTPSLGTKGTRREGTRPRIQRASAVRHHASAALLQRDTEPATEWCHLPLSLVHHGFIVNMELPPVPGCLCPSSHHKHGTAACPWLSTPT